jgi:hypothetical protein
MVFGLFGGSKYLDKLSKNLFSDYGTDEGVVNLIFDAAKKKFIAIPKEANHAEHMSILLELEKDELFTSEAAKRMIPLIIEFNENNKATRLVTGFSGSIEQLNGEIEFNPDDIKTAHALMMKMLYDSKLNAPHIREKMF